MHHKQKLSNSLINSLFEDQAPFCTLISQRKDNIASGKKVILSVFKALQDKRSLQTKAERFVTEKKNEDLLWKGKTKKNSVVHRLLL